MANHIKRISRRIRGVTQRVQTLEEERQPDVEPVRIRRMFEEAIAEENVTITVTNDPVAIFDETDFNRSEFGTTSDADSNTIVSEETVSNTTTIELDEYRAQDTAGSGSDDDSAVEFGVGTDDTPPSYSDRSLNAPASDNDGNDVRFTIDEFEIDGTTVIMNGFLSTSQGNEQTITEAAVFSDQGRMYNHATHSPIDKGNSESVTYEAQFTFDTAGGS